MGSQPIVPSYLLVARKWRVSGSTPTVLRLARSKFSAKELVDSVPNSIPVYSVRPTLYVRIDLFSRTLLIVRRGYKYHVDITKI